MLLWRNICKFIFCWKGPDFLRDSCLDAAAEKALLPSFDGCIGEIKIPGKMVLVLLWDLSFEICIFSTTKILELRWKINIVLSNIQLLPIALFLFATLFLTLMSMWVLAACWSGRWIRNWNCKEGKEDSFYDFAGFAFLKHKIVFT